MKKVLREKFGWVADKYGVSWQLSLFEVREREK
ncbi:MAG: VOC family protein [Chloroflexi bacterium]|nr:VOC family protein [Chloroflexota bacterium]